MNKNKSVIHEQGAIKSNIKSIAIAGLFSVSGVIVAFFVGWLILAPMNFHYGLWHDVGGIGWAIDRYGPENRYKQGFARLTKEERVEVFAQINTAVHNHGSGLREIEFRVPGLPPQKLLRQAEIQHLQDVANLLDKTWFLTIPACILWVLMMFVFVARHIPPPSLKKQLLSLLAVIILGGVVVVVIGPTAVFSWMHEVVFHDGQWFFYYQNSLMSTMMWAPRLFGWITVEWLLLAIVLFGLLQFLAIKLVKFGFRYRLLADANKDEA